MKVSPRAAISTFAVAIFATASCVGSAQSSQQGVFTVDFTNDRISPSHWVLTLHRDGTGHFHADREESSAPKKSTMDVEGVDRDIQLSKDYTEQIFSVARDHNWFKQKCESGAKVAFQGWKKLSYEGPEGQGSCTFNYSQDKKIQALGESLLGVAETLREGARLELLLQHDRLGLDQEMQYIADSAKDGRLREISAIKGILQRLADDEELLDRVRKRAKTLLAQSGS
jgi:hypothetical protein